MIFVTFLKWTTQGARTPQDAAKRAQGARALAEKLGGKILSTYVVTAGDCNVVAIADMPNGDAMAKLAAAVMASGNAIVTVARGLTPEEYAKLASEIPAP